MKKTLLLLFALIGLTATAQIKVTHNGQEIKDGETVTIYVENDDFGGASYEGMNPIITNLSEKKVQLSVTVKTTAEDMGKFSWCGITEQCQPMRTTEETRTAELGVLPAFIALHAIFNGGEYGECNAEVSISTDGTKALSFTLKFVYDEKHAAGIVSAPAEGGRIAPDGKALRYDFGTDAARKLTVFGADGRMVTRTALRANEGRINLGGLPQGIYIYSLEENGKQTRNGKFVIK